MENIYDEVYNQCIYYYESYSFSDKSYRIYSMIMDDFNWEFKFRYESAIEITKAMYNFHINYSVTQCPILEKQIKLLLGE